MWFGWARARARRGRAGRGKGKREKEDRMGLRQISVTIKGLPPGLLQHRYPLEPVEAIEKRSVEEQGGDRGISGPRHEGAVHPG